MKTASIYKITNTKNDDIYVGSTVQPLKSSFKSHKSNANLNKTGKLYDCMRENGVENFAIELIEEFEATSKENIGEKAMEYYKTIEPTLNERAPQISLGATFGRVYKLYNKLDRSYFYIGSTTESINTRLIKHKSASTNGTTPIYTFMREIGKDNFSADLIEDDVPFDNLIARENYWIQELIPPLNTHTFLTRTEQERDKAKYERNKEAIKKRVNDRRIVMRDEINAQKREHYAENREEILAKQRTQEYKDNANKLRNERKARERLERHALEEKQYLEKQQALADQRALGNLDESTMTSCSIYKITNTVTDDIYVGSTTQKLSGIFKVHKSKAKTQSDSSNKLHKLMQEHGSENFSVHLVEDFKFENKREIPIKERIICAELKPSLN